MKRLLRSMLMALACVFLASFAVAEDKVRLVLKGYDPVAYFTDGKPVQGDPKISYEWDEGRYYFADAKHRDMFAADPERYAPQFSGYCTGSMSRGVRNEGNPLAWVVVDGRLFVFGAKDAEQAEKYRQAALGDPAAFKVKVAAAAKNWSAAK